MFENSRKGRQARNFTTNVPKILDLILSSEQIFSENCRWVPLNNENKYQAVSISTCSSISIVLYWPITSAEVSVDTQVYRYLTPTGSLNIYLTQIESKVLTLTLFVLRTSFNPVCPAGNIFMIMI